MKRFQMVNWRSALDTIASVVVIIAGLSVVWIQWSRSQATDRTPDTPSAPVSLADATLKGLPTAQAVLMVFSDFECPYCGRFAREAMPELERDYVSTGRAQIAFSHFPLPIHGNALLAAAAAECAGAQGRFWEMHDALFAPDVSLGRDRVAAVATSINLDVERFETCLASDDAGLERFVQLARDLGVVSTPTFLIGRREADNTLRVSEVVSGFRATEDLRAALDRALQPERTSWWARLFALTALI